MKRRLPIYCFNWPSNVGGADTKFVHLLLLLHRDYDITVVPNTREQFEQLTWRRWLAGLEVKSALLEDLPQKLSGWGLSLCNGKFWSEGLGIEAHRRGLRIIWSSEMMWHHGERRRCRRRRGSSPFTSFATRRNIGRCGGKFSRGEVLREFNSRSWPSSAASTGNR